MTEEAKPLISKIGRFLPAVEKPSYKESFNNRLKWTGVALISYLILSHVPVYGIISGTYEQFRFLELVLGSKFGSLMTLGIGPLVEAGIILQLLVGSKIINWDMSKPEEREKFQTWNKFLAIVFCFLTAVAYILGGALPVKGGLGIVILVILQLALGGVIVILLDELVTKWGFGSGVSLFIAAGVTSQIVIGALSPLTSNCKAFQFATCIPSVDSQPVGAFWKFLINAFVGDISAMLEAFIPLLSTAVVFLIVIYVQGISVDIPLAFSSLRGFGRTWGLKLLYTSNIPVIFAASLIASSHLILGRIGVTTTPDGLQCGIFGCYDQQGRAVSGLVYYISTPTNFLLKVINSTVTSADFIRVGIHILLFAVLGIAFSVFWVSTSGMDAKSVAEQIDSIGMQIPGYRKDPRIMESVLNRYIPALSVLGGLAVGLLAALADITSAISTGTGILLAVMIIYQYYEQLSAENLEEAHPWVRKILSG